VSAGYLEDFEVYHIKQEMLAKVSFVLIDIGNNISPYRRQIDLFCVKL